MKKIIGIIRPFDLYQNFYIYGDGEKIVAAQLKQEEIPSTILSWSRMFNTNQIDLAGPKQYNLGLKKMILKEEFNKYNKNTLNINLI